MELARVLKCQDLSPTRGMATVGKELSAHLHIEGTEYFSDCLRVFTLVRKRMLSVRVDEPEAQKAALGDVEYALCTWGRAKLH